MERPSLCASKAVKVCGSCTICARAFLCLTMPYAVYRAAPDSALQATQLYCFTLHTYGTVWSGP
jgi:hypothetical protein